MPNDVAGVLLAGGRARRMGGGDKGLLRLAGRPILDHVIARVRPQVAALVLNANGDPARFGGFDLPIVTDTVEGFAGPLAGIHAGMKWARENRPSAKWLASVPTDTPLLPRDLVARLEAAAVSEGAVIACAESSGRRHPVAALWSLALEAELHRALVEEGVRKVDDWMARHPLATVAFAAMPVDPFFNVNTPADLEEAERLIARGKA